MNEINNSNACSCVQPDAPIPFQTLVLPPSFIRSFSSSSSSPLRHLGDADREDGDPPVWVVAQMADSA